MNILETIASRTVERIAEEKKQISVEAVRRDAEYEAKGREAFRLKMGIKAAGNFFYL